MKACEGFPPRIPEFAECPECVDAPLEERLARATARAGEVLRGDEETTAVLTFHGFGVGKATHAQAHGDDTPIEWIARDGPAGKGHHSDYT